MSLQLNDTEMLAYEGLQAMFQLELERRISKVNRLHREIEKRIGLAELALETTHVVTDTGQIVERPKTEEPELPKTDAPDEPQNDSPDEKGAE